MKVTSTLLAAYLLATLVPLLLGHPDGTGAGVALVHVALAAFLVRQARQEGPDRVSFGAWLPLLLIPFLYGELPLLNQWAGPGYHDALIQGWERALFGSEPAYTWATAAPYALLSEPLHLAYLSYYPLIYVPPLVLWLQHRTEAFHTMVLAVVTAFLACYVVFVVFPVQGPRYLGTPPGVPDGPVRALVLEILQRGSSRGAAFPSSHVAAATVQAFMAVRFLRPWGWAVVVLSGGLAVGAVYGGFHYGIDALVGAAVGLMACGVALAFRPSPKGTTEE